jgi:hypothetical protein
VIRALSPPLPSDGMDVAQLVREIERYLKAIALYRELGCQPTWRSEWPSPDRERLPGSRLP